MPKRKDRNVEEMTLGERLDLFAPGQTAEDHAARRIAQARGHTPRSELAARVNKHLPSTKQIPYQAVGEIESGKRRLRLDELFAFAAALGVAPIYLITPIRDDEAWFRVGPTGIKIPFARDWIEGRKLPASFGRDDATRQRYYIEQVPARVAERRHQDANKRMLKSSGKPTPRADGGVLWLAARQKLEAELNKEEEQ